MNDEKTNKIMSSEELDDVLPKYEPIKLSGKNLAQNYVSAFNTGMNIYQCVNYLQGNIDWTIKAVNDVVKSWNTEVSESIDQSKAIVRETTTEQFNTEWTNKQPELIEQVNTLTTNQFNIEKSVFNDELNTLDARIDTFTRLSEGSTTGDAELKDIRVGANGVTYNNAGDAVRGQYSQLKEDLVQKIDKPTIADNNKFPRAKDGNVEWVEQGLPTYDQTESAVTNWLNAHPEATTTVQDGSLTSEKFTDDLKLHTLKDYVTPQMFGAKADGTTDDSEAIRKAIIYSIKSSETYNVKMPIVFPTGIYNIERDCLFSDFDLRSYGFNIIDGLTFIGTGRSNTILKLMTKGAEKWFYNNKSVDTQKFQRINFIDLRFETDDTKNGNGFKQFSKGGEKQFRFFRCYFSLNKIIQLEGTGNADLNRFSNCSIDAFGDLITFNNSQSVATIFQNTDINIRKNLVTVLEKGGGDLIISNCSIEMHETNGNDTEDYFLFNVPNVAMSSNGNCHYLISGCRFELHGSKKKLVKTVNGNYPIDITLEHCWFGVDDGPQRIVAEIYPSKILKFINCALHDNFLFKVIGNYSDSGYGSCGATILFDTCDVGRNKTLHERIEIDSDFYRVRANNCYKLSSTGSIKAVPQDFDYGWDLINSYSILATKKIVPIFNHNIVFPIPTSETYDMILTLPKNPYVTKIYIKRGKITSSNGDYQLHIGNEDKSIILGSSELKPFSEEHIINVENIGKLDFNVIKIWATGVAGTPTMKGMGYIEFI